jgi:diacylglycerol kinase (ATP)
MRDPRSAAALRPQPDQAHSALPLRLGVLSNKLSTRNRRDMAGLQAVLSGRPDVMHIAIEDWTGLSGALARLLAENLDALVVNGGDGTVVGVLSELRRRAPAHVPALAVLASGNTNMIAGDVGLPNRPERALSRLLSAAASSPALRRAERRLIRIEQPGEPTRYGFFVGAIAILRAILLTRRILHPLGVNHGLANAAGIGLSAMRVLFGRTGDEGLLSPVPVDIAFDGEPTASGEYSALMASTLDRLLFGSRPFWGSGPGPIRLTMVRGPAARPLRSLLPLLRGRPDERMTRAGYVSRNADRITFAFDGRFVIDGEIFEATRERPITLSDGGAVEFLRC